MILDMQVISAASFASAMALSLVVFPSPSNTLAAPIDLDDPSELVPVGPDHVLPAIFIAAPDDLAEAVAQIDFCAHFVRVSDTGEGLCDELAYGLAELPELVNVPDGYWAGEEVHSDGIEEAYTVLANYCRARWADAVESGYAFDTAECPTVDIPIATGTGSL